MMPSIPFCMRRALLLLACGLSWTVIGLTPTTRTAEPPPRKLPWPASKSRSAVATQNQTSKERQLTSEVKRASYDRSEAYPLPADFAADQLLKQSAEEAAAKSQGCVTCHQGVGDMHDKPTVRLGCVDCHGGDPTSTDKNCASRASLRA